MADPTTTYRLYLFKGKQYLKIDPVTMKILSQPGPIGDWTGLAAALNDGAELDRIDAANYGKDGVVFFKGSKYCVFDPQTGTAPTYGNISDYFQHLPNDAHGDFTQDLDAVLTDGNSNLMIFKGAYCTVARGASRDCGGTSALFSSVWSVPAPYALGVQAATALVPVRQDWLVFRGDSWTTYETQKSITIETLVPGLEQYGFDYGLDAALMAPFDKKPSMTSCPVTVPAGTALTVTVLNNLATQATVDVTLGGGAADPIQAPPGQETHKTYTATTGTLDIAVKSGQGEAMRLLDGNEQVGGGNCLYIGAEQQALGLYTDVVVLVTWPSKVA